MLNNDQGPYGRYALRYIEAGWPEVLPIYRGGQKDKQPIIKGYHGREGLWPDGPTCGIWARKYGRANLALRLPRWVIGLDVDHYNGKSGGDTLSELESELGPLPVCPVSTSRDDGISGIRLFMLPGDYTGAAWPSQAGDDIEVITWYERYVICAPSVHATGRVYRWIYGNVVLRAIPKPDSLPMLSDDWCEYLVDRAGADSRWDDTGYDGSAAEWLAKYGVGTPCRYILNIWPRWLWALDNGGSAHEAAKLAVSQAVKAAAEGHVGVNSALWDVRREFIKIVSSRGANERRRGENKAISEWRSMVSGAVAKYGGDVAAEDTICDELDGF